MIVRLFERIFGDDDNEAKAPPTPEELANLDPEEWAKLFEAGATYMGDVLFEAWDDLDELPQDVRDTLEHINNIETADGEPDLPSRMEEIHRYASQRITCIPEHGDPILTFPQAAEAMQGDCDNYAILNMGMLINAGFDPQDVSFHLGRATFEYDGKTMSADHSFTIVEIEGKRYLMDNNFDAPVELDENGHGVGTYKGKELAVKIDETYVEYNGHSAEPEIHSTMPNPFADNNAQSYADTPALLPEMHIA